VHLPLIALPILRVPGWPIEPGLYELLLLVGVLMVTGQFTRLAGWLQGLTPEFLRQWL